MRDVEGCKTDMTHRCLQTALTVRTYRSTACSKRQRGWGGVGSVGARGARVCVSLTVCSRSRVSLIHYPRAAPRCHRWRGGAGTLPSLRGVFIWIHVTGVADAAAGGTTTTGSQYHAPVAPQRSCIVRGKVHVKIIGT